MFCKELSVCMEWYRAMQHSLMFCEYHKWSSIVNLGYPSEFRAGIYYCGAKPNAARQLIVPSVAHSDLNEIPTYHALYIYTHMCAKK